jgi:hypothetical protein
MLIGMKACPPPAVLGLLRRKFLGDQGCVILECLLPRWLLWRKRAQGDGQQNAGRLAGRQGEAGEALGRERRSQFLQPRPLLVIRRFGPSAPR